ncbi:thioredoxin domain-containing protein [Aliiglaciecola sp. LCG003]|uniref:thioredoxin domain-containing protein n=1 Tax=Aliiglaciecola sp. LCG003 TaxID=3053655 RepID=UPI002572C0E5|nr:thioredoxin domain-containing protein [Aliiglaciecola sp. LCG003]WJG09166.1 thioredoxin domain-containing protein [Aliiglaciecola sp. LCG003]
MREKTHLVCPACWCVNRVPLALVEHSPMCGRCNTKLFNGKPLSLSSLNILMFLERNEMPIVIIFYAPKSDPKKNISLSYDLCASFLEPYIRLAKVNIDKDKELAWLLGVKTTPTITIFHHNHEVARSNSLATTEDIVKWVKDFSLSESKP